MSSPRSWGQEFDVFERDPAAPFKSEGKYAVVSISGPLSQRTGFFTDSYDDIRTRVGAALESECAAVCLRIDSPGGDWCGALELARDLRQMAAAKAKRLVAFTDGQALSAGYALACAASEIVATESASVGSVGVWAPLVDVTAQDAMMGVKFAIAASGIAKADRNPHVGLTDEAFTRLQDQVLEQADIFFRHVSDTRGMSVDALRSLQGAEEFGERARKNRLSDRLVNSWSAFLTSEGSPMASKANKYGDEAKVALRRMAESEDEEEKKKAEKALKALEEGEESDEDKKKKDEEAKAKAAADDDEKKKKEGEEKAKAAALSANSLAMAQELQVLKAKDAARDAADAARAEAEKRSAMMGKRPDLSPAQAAVLAYVPLDKLQAHLDALPRVNASPGSSAAAMTPGIAGGERREGHETLTTEQQALLDRVQRNTAQAKAGELHGTEFSVPIYDPAAVKARLAAMKEKN
jgi:capsid assembly protease